MRHVFKLVAFVTLLLALLGCAGGSFDPSLANSPSTLEGNGAWQAYFDVASDRFFGAVAFRLIAGKQSVNCDITEDEQGQTVLGCRGDSSLGASHSLAIDMDKSGDGLKGIANSLGLVRAARHAAVDGASARQRASLFTSLELRNVRKGFVIYADDGSYSLVECDLLKSLSGEFTMTLACLPIEISLESFVALASLSDATGTGQRK